jgi:hypothetical protein
MDPWVGRKAGGEVAEEPMEVRERPLHVDGT